MLPITCNAVGDIIAILTIISNIVQSLNESRGAPAEYRDFIHELESMQIVLPQISNIAESSSDATVRDYLDQEVQKCQQLVVDAGDRLSGFSMLAQAPSAVSRRLDRLRRQGKKFQWRFLRRDEVGDFKQKFKSCRDRLALIIMSLQSSEDGKATLLQSRESSEAIQHQIHDVSSSVRHDIESSRQAVLASQVDIHADLRHTTSLVEDASSFLCNDMRHELSSIRRNQQNVPTRQDLVASDLSLRTYFAGLIKEAFSRFAGQQATKRNGSDRQIVTAVAEDLDVLDKHAAVICVALIAFSAADVMHRNLRTVVLYVALFVMLRTVWRLQKTIPKPIYWSESNMIMLVDVLDRRIPVPIQFCESYDFFHDTLVGLFSGKSGSTFVKSGAYVLEDTRTSAVVGRRTWKKIKAGMVLEMSVIMLQRPGVTRFVQCPWCHAETFKSVVDGQEEYTCMGCSRTSRKAVVEEVKNIDPSEKGATDVNSRSSQAKDSVSTQAKDSGSTQVMDLRSAQAPHLSPASGVISNPVDPNLPTDSRSTKSPLRKGVTTPSQTEDVRPLKRIHLILQSGDAADSSLLNNLPQKQPVGYEPRSYEDGQNKGKELEDPLLRPPRLATDAFDAATADRITHLTEHWSPADDGDEQLALRLSSLSLEEFDTEMHKMFGTVDESGDTTRLGNQDSASQIRSNSPAALDGSDIDLMDKFKRLKSLEAELPSNVLTEQMLTLISQYHKLRPRVLLHERAQRLAVEGTSLLKQAMTTFEPEALDAAISCLENSIDLTPEGYPNKPERLDVLGIAHITRFNRLGDLDNLESAIV
ncbi:hypothetical protein K488DRAFT_89074, partial [Vararia minispora EC-137]